MKINQLICLLNSLLFFHSKAGIYEVEMAIAIAA